MESLGTKIYKLRKSARMSQEELAFKLGVSRQSVSNWETDSLQPKADKLTAMCELFGVSMDYLFQNDNLPSEEKAVAAADNGKPKNKKLLVSILICAIVLIILVAAACAMLAVLCVKLFGNQPSPTPPESGVTIGDYYKGVFKLSALVVGIIASLILSVVDLIFLIRLIRKK